MSRFLFVQALLSGDLTLIEKELQGGESLNKPFMEEDIPEEITKLFTEKVTQVFPLEMAFRSNSPKVIQYLLDKGAPIQNTPFYLYHGVQNSPFPFTGLIGTLDALLWVKSSLIYDNDDEESWLKIYQKLVKNGLNFSVSLGWGISILHASCDHPLLFQFALEQPGMEKLINEMDGECFRVIEHLHARWIRLYASDNNSELMRKMMPDLYSNEGLGIPNDQKSILRFDLDMHKNVLRAFEKGMDSLYPPVHSHPKYKNWQEDVLAKIAEVQQKMLNMNLTQASTINKSKVKL